jgi:hypothetical protein
MDSYQPIYDAVRSRISNGNVGDVVERAARDAFDMGNMRAILTEQFCAAAMEMARPSVVYKPTLMADGDMWCVLLGDDLQVGVAGFGKTVAEAMTAFDQAFYKERTPDAIRQDRIDNGQFGVGA